MCGRCLEPFVQIGKATDRQSKVLASRRNACCQRIDQHLDIQQHRPRMPRVEALLFQDCRFGIRDRFIHVDSFLFSWFVPSASFRSSRLRFGQV